MGSIVKELTGGQLDCTADKKTVSQFAYELGVISDIQVGEAMVSHKNMTIAWDATSLDASHVNEVHINLPTIPPKGLVLQVGTLAGGTTDDYAEHIKISIDDVATSFSMCYKKEITSTKALCINNIKNSISDGAAVNHCVVEKLQQDLDIDLLELKCNVHPLDGLASKCRSVLKEIDSQLQIKSETFGRDCRAANFIYGVSKMRFKQGKGDPSGFNLFMRQEKIGSGQIIRYVGNRLHVIFHLAGVFFSLKEKLLHYMTKLCNNTTSLRTALKKDLENEPLTLQLRALGLIGKYLTGPWMRIFYGNKDCLTNLETIPLMKICIKNLESLKEHPLEILTMTKDAFNKTFSEDATLCSLQNIQYPPAMTEMFKSVISSLLSGILIVLKRQLKPYLEGNLSSPTEDMLIQTKSAPIHNIFSEETLGLTDHQFRRAPNATIGFIDGKVKARKNHTLSWLDEKQQEEQELIVSFAIGRAAKIRALRKQRDMLIQKSLEKRQKEKEKKRVRGDQKKIEKHIKDIISGESEVKDEFPDITDDKLTLFESIVADPTVLVGRYLEHVWETENGEDTLYHGKVIKTKTTPRTKVCTVTISYWTGEEALEDSEDFLMPLSQILADFYSGDLVLIQPDC